MEKFTKFASSIGVLGGLYLLVAVLAMFSLRPLQAQTAGTKLQLGAYWDNGAKITGTVTLKHTGADNNLVTDYSHSTTGWVSTTLPIQPNVLYTVTLSATNPLTNAAMNYSLQFLVPSLVINPANIISASYKVTLSRTTNLPVPGETHLSVEI